MSLLQLTAWPTDSRHSLLNQLFSEHMIDVERKVLYEYITEDPDLIAMSEKFPGGSSRKSREMERERAQEQESITLKLGRETQESTGR